MILDLEEPPLESFYLPFVAGIDLPHQGVVDSYNLTWNLIGPHMGVKICLWCRADRISCVQLYRMWYICH